MEQISNIKHISGPDIVCLEGNGARPSHKGNGWSIGGVMYTLNSTEVHCVAYSIHSYNSEGALKSKSLYAHEVDKVRILDATTINPACNQGGVAIVEIHQSGVPSDRFENKD